MIRPAANYPLNCGLADSAFSRSFSKGRLAERTGDAVIIVQDKILDGSVSVPLVVDDVKYDRVTPALVGTSLEVDVEFRPSRFKTIKTITTRDPQFAAPTETFGYFDYVDSGLARFIVEFDDGEKLATSFVLKTEQGATADIFNSFVDGSLCQHLVNEIEQYADGSTSSPLHYAYYSTFDFQNNVFSKNSACWAAGIDLSATSVKTTGGNVPSGVVNAITPHHAIGSWHYSPTAPNVGSTVFFCGNDNTTVSRTVSHRIDVGDVYGWDLFVIRFSEPLPPSISPYKTLPSAWSNYAPEGMIFTPLESPRGNWPVIVTSHYRWDAAWPLQRNGRFVYIYNGSRILTPFGTSWMNPLGLPSVGFVPAEAGALSFPDYTGIPSGIRGGDSGGPAFIVINGQPVLMCLLQTATSGKFLPAARSDIQTALDTLGPGGQTFSTVDLSEFTNFAT